MLIKNSPEGPESAKAPERDINTSAFKDGWRTTEFWGSIVMSVLVAIGPWATFLSTKFPEGSWQWAVAASAAAVAAIWIKYMHGRDVVKTNQTRFYMLSTFGKILDTTPDLKSEPVKEEAVAERGYL